MAESITVARPYAEAIARLAREENSYQQWSDTLATLACIAQDTRVLDMVSHPKLVKADVIQFLLECLGEQKNDQIKNVITLMLDNRRFIVLPLVAQLYEAMRAEDEGVAKALIETAFAIDDSEVSELTRRLEKHFKQKFEATIVVNPELIGGIRVTVGDEVMDASIRGKLSSLAASLKS